MLERHIRDTLRQKNILVMTHIVIGYPDLETSFALVKAMVEGGADLMELQIPFSEPIADGPVIEQANQRALKNGITVAECLRFAGRCASAFRIPFLFMSYYNILYCHGVTRFVADMKTLGMSGAIVPDLPPEEGQEYTAAMKEARLDPIFLFSPTTPPERMKKIGREASGFIYCVARKGVTGENTAWSGQVERYLAQARASTDLPLAVGFGVRHKSDVDFLAGKAEIAVIGSEMIRIADSAGVTGVAARLQSLH